LYWRRVQKISIILANLEEFLVIPILHETNIPMVYIWRSRCTLNFKKIKFEKKWNLQSPWGMEDWTLLSFKNWGCCTHTPPRSPGPCYMQGPKKKLKKKKDKFYFFKWAGRKLLGARRAAGGRPLVAGRSVGPLNYQATPPPFFCFVAPFFSNVVNSSSLAPAHARPTQTSTQNFKHP
jgi:hypothetical protein